MSDIKKETIHLEDGRKADKIVVDDGVKTVTEIWAEPQIEKKITKRIIEHREPVIVRREIETVNDNGEVVDVKVETTAPEVKMELREHIVSGVEDVSALSEEPKYVTMDDLQNVLNMLVEKLANAKDVVVNEASSIQKKLESKIVTEVNASGTSSTFGMIAWGAVAIVAGIFAYVVYTSL